MVGSSNQSVPGMAIGIGSLRLRTVSSCPVAITSSAATACEAAELKEGESNWEILWIYPLVNIQKTIEHGH